MVALAIVLIAVVVLLSVLVAGLLRSHADILKALHDLGVGVGDPTGENGHRSAPVAFTAGPVGAAVTMGPPLPPERNSTTAPALAGVTPTGDALALSVDGGDRLTLLAFLSSGCSTCAGFWSELGQPEQLGFPERLRLVVVTKGPEMEIPAEVASRAAGALTVIMSTDAWSDYEVPGSPFFVLVDGLSGRRIGEGVANHVHQIVDLVRRAEADARPLSFGTRETPGGSRAYAVGLDGPTRESANDRELAAAGIMPGDPSLYPTSLDDLFGRTAGPAGVADTAGAANSTGPARPTGQTGPADAGSQPAPVAPTSLAG